MDMEHLWDLWEENVHKPGFDTNIYYINFSFNSNALFFLVAMLDMNISQFMKSLGLEHLRDIFEREQVS